MKQLSYRERDYAFGQMMLTLRTAIGLTQSGLADFLGVSRRAVGEWEAGSKYPKPQHLKQFIAFAVEHRAFHPGYEAEEIRAFWHAARQRCFHRIEPVNQRNCTIHRPYQQKR